MGRNVTAVTSWAPQGREQQCHKSYDEENNWTRREKDEAHNAKKLAREVLEIGS